MDLADVVSKPYVDAYKALMKVRCPDEFWTFLGPATATLDGPKGTCALCGMSYAGNGYVWVWGRFFMTSQSSHGTICWDLTECAFRRAVRDEKT